jgi:ubiquinone/menaquinone biosynthesis C-methylase UbiE
MPNESLRDVIDFYTNTAEESRLGAGVPLLEFERTRELLRRFLSPPPLRVIDVGGAAGPYAFWLADLGYEVHLIDATSRLVEVARQHDGKATRRLASIDEGDARRLPFDDASVDAVLLLGPLYHLPDRADRLAALTEARRVLRSRGVAFAAGISRYAGVLDGLVLHPDMDDQIVTMRHRAIADGQYRNETDNVRYFTTAYFHRPEELEREVSEAGFQDACVLGVEGPGWLLADFDARWAEATTRERILQVARLVEEEPSLMGASAHLLAVGYRP